MKKSLIIGLAALVFAANLSCYAADKQKIAQIKLVDLKDIKDATAMENAFSSYLTQKSNCRRDKKVSPDTCKHLSEFYQAQKVYKDTAKQHPDWQDKVLHWNTPSDHYLYFNSLKISFK